MRGSRKQEKKQKGKIRDKDQLAEGNQWSPSNNLNP